MTRSLSRPPGEVRRPHAEGRTDDRIELRGLRVLGTHGVLPEERSRPQPFEIDLDLEVDLVAAGSTDELEDTVDYAGVVDGVRQIVSGSTSFELLEALGTAIATSALAADPRVVSVTVGVRKLQPPLAADIATVGVRITRCR